MDTGSSTFLILVSVMVFLMSLPGLALFYGAQSEGEGRGRPETLRIMSQCVCVAAVASAVWILGGFSLVFSPTSWGVGSFHLGGVLSDLSANLTSTHNLLSLRSVVNHKLVPTSFFAFFQLWFIVIAACLVLGGVIGDLSTSFLCLFSFFWCFIVYVPIAHSVWGVGGWIASLGAVDFAGGGVVHLNAGVASLVMAFWISRRDHEKNLLKSNPLKELDLSFNRQVMMTLGMCLIWFGWFGFNAGSALSPNLVAGVALLSTQIAAFAGLSCFLLIAYFYKKKVTLWDINCGVVAGLVGITPGAAYFSPVCSFLVGFLSAAASAFWIFRAKFYLVRHGIVDRLDVFAQHGIPGIVGAILIGVLSDRELTSLNPNFPDVSAIHLTLSQCVAMVLIILWSVVGTWLALTCTRSVRRWVRLLFPLGIMIAKRIMVRCQHRVKKDS